jgi:NAD(P)-dependent dehydrogenase (short-subunit alcohol dehydrogenase family)
MHSRTQDEGDLALCQLVNEGVDPARLCVVTADFTRLDDVVSLAQQVVQQDPELQLLVNNAAMAGPQNRNVTCDGNEVTFQVNYVAPYLLTRLLASHLRPGARVVNVSSSHHRGANLNWSDFTLQRRYTPHVAYAQSKLALTVFTNSLASFGDSGLTAVSVHPGPAETRLLPAYGYEGQPAHVAAAAVARLCSPTTPVVNGAYYEGLDLGTAAVCVTSERAMLRLVRASGLMASGIVVDGPTPMAELDEVTA